MAKTLQWKYNAKIPITMSINALNYIEIDYQYKEVHYKYTQMH